MNPWTKALYVSVDEPLRLGRDRAEDQRALARAGDTGEDGQPPLRDLNAHVLEIVDARAVHPDHVVAVTSEPRKRLRARPRGDAHASP